MAMIVSLAGVVALSAWAQSGTSSALAGSIADQSGAMLPAAQVKATEVNTGAVRIVQSNAAGRFLFSQVNPGTYRIEVRAAGFGVAVSQPQASPSARPPSSTSRCHSHPPRRRSKSSRNPA